MNRHIYIKNQIMRVLIFGGNGWIGQQFVEIASKQNIEHRVAASRVDFDHIAELEREMDEFAPTHVVSFLGRTHGENFTTIDYLEQPGKLVDNVRDNLMAPIILAQLCAERDIHYTYLGTGCIFNGVYDEEDNCVQAFKETDAPNFFGSSYSIVKGFTDRFMAWRHGQGRNQGQLQRGQGKGSEEGCGAKGIKCAAQCLARSSPVLNLRIRMPIVGEDHPRNFITKITRYEKVCSVHNSMSVLPELLPMALELMKNKYIGTLNFTNPGVISHNEILALYKKHVDPAFEWHNFSLQEQDAVLASKRSNNCLDTHELQRLFPIVKPIGDAVEDLMKTYKRIHLDGGPRFPDTHVGGCCPPVEDAAAMTILVTGGAGFIGSHFINAVWDQYKNIRIVNADALYYCANVMNVADHIRSDMRYVFVKCNLRNKDEIDSIFHMFDISHVVHFAAQSHVQTSFTDAMEYTMDNVVGTHNLLESARLHCPQLQKFIHVSTDEVYGESMMHPQDVKKTEQSVLCPTNPYAATKAAAELIAQSYYHSFRMPIIITRGNNVYGPRQYPEKVIPRFIKQLRENQPVTIHGDGSCLRAFLHVDDAASAFITILARGAVGEIYNIGCDEGMEYSVIDIARMLIRLIKGRDDPHEKWIQHVEDRPFNDKRYYISNSKLKALGWTIRVGFEDGIRGIVQMHA
jgi:dTDP-glucose 4,6-dehydratase